MLLIGITIEPGYNTRARAQKRASDISAMRIIIRYNNAYIYFVGPNVAVENKLHGQGSRAAQRLRIFSLLFFFLS